MEKNKNFEFVAGALAGIVCYEWLFPLINTACEYVGTKIGTKTAKLNMETEVFAHERQAEMAEIDGNCGCDCQTNAIGFTAGDAEELYEDESEDE